jgi:restriction system protein
MDGISEEKKVWGIHTQNDNLFLGKDLIAIGWRDFGDLTKVDASRDAFKAHYLEAYPDAKKGQVANGAGMLFRFIHEVQIGDYVVFPSKSDRKINIGTVEGDYYYEDNDGEYVQRRKVKWLKHIPRLSFSQGALYEVGSAMSFFSVKNYADEFLTALDKDFKKTATSDEVDDDSVGATADDIVENTKDFILKELSRQLKGYDLEQFVADLLRAMGYRTTVSPQGGDSGIDITAYKDELPPRILVQVKSQDSDIKETTIQSLKGAMREGDYGLFVTLSNYTKNAQKYLDSTPIIRGINGTELVDLILKYYEELSEKYRKMIPLKMVYIPVPKDEN